MFGFRNRNKFNTDVDVILRTAFDIETDHNRNAAFPGVLSYMAYLDEVWNERGTAEHAAARMACLYYMGLAKNGTPTEKNEAKALGQRIEKAIRLYVSCGQISENKGGHYLGLVSKYAEHLR
jgi:hypothetical protein